MGKARFVTLATEEMADVWALARKTWAPYCARHGHELIEYSFPFDRALHPSWNKLYAVLEALKMTQGPVWWFDCDTLVANPSIDIEAATPQSRPMAAGKDIYFSQDWNGICCALFRVDNTAWVRRFLNVALLLGDVADPDAFGKGLGPKWEQNAIKLLVREFPAIAKRIGTLPADWVNDRPGDPKATDIIWHFSVMSNDLRVGLMERKLEAMGIR